MAWRPYLRDRLIDGGTFGKSGLLDHVQRGICPGHDPQGFSRASEVGQGDLHLRFVRVQLLLGPDLVDAIANPSCVAGVRIVEVGLRGRLRALGHFHHALLSHHGKVGPTRGDRDQALGVFLRADRELQRVLSM